MATSERLVIENLLMIADKEGNDVPFVLNDAQVAVDSRLTGRDIIPKARQRGVTSYFLARNLVRCLSRRNTRAVIIAHEEDATKRMLRKVHYMLENIKGPKAVIKNASANEIVFSKTNSVFYIGTAGARQFGRGDTITDLHCSEVAFWKDPKSLLGGLFQAVPRSGNVSIESSGNGTGNWFHRATMRAASGNSRYRMHFLPWQDEEEYYVHLTDSEEARLLNNLSEEYEEPQLLARGFSPQQIAFRREKLEELDYDVQLFKQEYPETLDECFQATGFSIFAKVNFEPSDLWKSTGNGLHVMESHPKPYFQYAIGGDVSAGVGKDYSVAEIFCLNTKEQVGEYRNNRIDPEQFGYKLCTLGKQFNDAYITCENNNHGILTVKILKQHYPMYLLFNTPRRRKGGQEVDKITDYGFRTSVKSKPYAIGELRSMLSHEWVIHSTILKDELDTFIENDRGQLGAETGCYDDTVMASAMFAVSLDKANLMTTPRAKLEQEVEPDPFLLDNIIKECVSAGSDGHAISVQI